jgi:hypothetical protein
LGLGFVLGADRRLIDTTLVLERAAQVLDSVVVMSSPAFTPGKLADVERRRAAGFGKILTRAELHDPLNGGLDVQLRRFARIRMAPLCRGIGVAPAAAFRLEPPVRVRCPRGELLDCFMAVYLDGSPYWSPDMGGVTPPPDFSTFSVLGLEAVEVYRGPAELPIEYGGPAAACGVVLLWTRVG